MTLRLGLPALLLALAAPARAGDGAPAKLAFDPLEVEKGVDRSLATLVEQRVCQALGEAVRGADLVCPEDVAAAASMARNAALMGQCATDDCMRNVEALKAAPRRVSGSLARDGERVVLRLVLREEGAAGPRSAEARLPADLDGLLGGVAAVVHQLIP